MTIRRAGVASMSWLLPGMSEDTAYVLVGLFIVAFAILRDLGRISKTLGRIEMLLQEAAREADRLIAQRGRHD